METTANGLGGARGALLGEYRKALDEFAMVLATIGTEQLTMIVDDKTTDPNCRSIQAVVKHVIHSGFGYAHKIESLKVTTAERRERRIHPSVELYLKDLDAMFLQTFRALEHFQDEDLEEIKNECKITTEWGQCYDAEQMMEHAIVHILRHRRQIERFKLILQPF